MSDWSIGDLAVRVGSAEPGATNVAKGGPPKGRIVRVDAVFSYPRWGQIVGIAFAAYPSPHSTRSWDSAQFRKIMPDKAEDCEPEFVTLVKRAKQPETAVEWLEQAGPIAAELNEESKHDGN